MSQRITAKNLELVITKNREIASEIDDYVNVVWKEHNPNKITSSPQLAFDILYRYGLIQTPIEDPIWSGAIFVRNGKKIPAINSAMPRANQYFTAWHEVYHLLFDRVSFDHMIGADTFVEERKAEYFASQMLLGDVFLYFCNLNEMDFESKIFYCMSLYGAPYKAVLISLYDEAVNKGINDVRDEVVNCFDRHYTDLPEKFQRLGLDDSIVRPSFVINPGIAAMRMEDAAAENEEVTYHNSHKGFMLRTLGEIRELAEGQDVQNS